MPVEPCPELAQLFEEYNRRYFRGHLPPVELAWVDPHPDELAWCHTYNEEGRPRCNKGQIHISTQIRHIRNTMKMALLHEMAHWKLRHHPIVGHQGRGDSHGHAFQREMKRLAAIGAFRQLW